MSERKKAKVQDDLVKMELLYKTLKAAEEGSTFHNEHITLLMDSISLASANQRREKIGVACRKVAIYSVLSLVELFRINGTTKIVSCVEFEAVFYLLYDFIVADFLDSSSILSLQTMILLRIPAHLKDQAIILSFINLLQPVDKNKENTLNESGLSRKAWFVFVKQIVTICIGAGNIPINTEIFSVISRHKDIIEGACKLITPELIQGLPEDRYVQLFMENKCIRQMGNLRIVKGKMRFQFLKSFLDEYAASAKLAHFEGPSESLRMDLESIFQNYVSDKDNRVKMLLAEKVHSGKYFQILLNDPCPEVRLAIVKNLHWNACDGDIADRLLDKSFDVRTELFRLYREGYNFLKGIHNRFLSELPLSTYDKNTPDSNYAFKICCIFKNNEFLNSEALEFEKRDVSTEKEYKKFMKFVGKLFEGCSTALKDEYFKILQESNFSITFLMACKSLTGADSLFKSLSKAFFPEYLEIENQCTAEGRFVYNYIFENRRGQQAPKLLREVFGSEIPCSDDSGKSGLESKLILNLISFSLEYLYSGQIGKEIIFDLIDKNVQPVLRYIGSTDINLFFNVLLSKALESPELELVETIVQLIKPILSTMKEIKAEKNLNATQSSLNFVNAHTLPGIDDEYDTSKILDDNASTDEFYSRLYFLTHRIPESVPKLLPNLTATDRKIRLLVYLNEPAVIGEQVDYLLRHELSLKMVSFIMAKKSVSASLIYFLSTGLVSIKNPSFFVRCIKVCLKSNFPEKVKFIFSRYISSVDQQSYNLFYSICHALKLCSTRNFSIKTQEIGSLIHTRITDDRSEISLINNPKITEDAPHDLDMQDIVDASGTIPAKEPTPTEDFKLKLPKEDKLLYFICNYVVGLRSGSILEIRSNFSKFGFFRLPENYVDMVIRDHVHYE